jgi:large subunit ribosomal protein L22
MEIKAKAKHIKASPRKVRLIVDLIRGLRVDQALDQLTFVNKKATGSVEKLVKSAIANALNNFELKEDNLFIKEIRVDEGPTMRRWQPRARGRACPIRKRTSHINLVLGEIVDSGEVKVKKQKIEAPIKLGAKPEEAEGVKVKDSKKATKPDTEEKGKKIVDPRGEGKGKNTKIEGKSTKAFGNKVFRRKAG